MTRGTGRPPPRMVSAALAVQALGAVQSESWQREPAGVLRMLRRCLEIIESRERTLPQAARHRLHGLQRQLVVAEAGVGDAGFDAAQLQGELARELAILGEMLVEAAFHDAS